MLAHVARFIQVKSAEHGFEFSDVDRFAANAAEPKIIIKMPAIKARLQKLIVKNKFLCISRAFYRLRTGLATLLCHT